MRKYCYLAELRVRPWLWAEQNSCISYKFCGLLYGHRWQEYGKGPQIYKGDTSYTTPCNGVVSHGAQIGGLRDFADHTRKNKNIFDK